MINSLANQLVPSNRNNPLAYPAVSIDSGSSALALSRHCEGNLQGGIMESTTHGVLLELLLNAEGSAESLRLCECLATARRESKCILSHMVRMGALLLLSLGGLGYFSFAQSGLFSDRAQVIIQNGLIFLCLVSLISEAQFLGYLVWHRVRTNPLHHQSRQLVLTLIGQRLSDSQQTALPLDWVRESAR